MKSSLKKSVLTVLVLLSSFASFQAKADFTIESSIPNTLKIDHEDWFQDIDAADFMFTDTKSRVSIVLKWTYFGTRCDVSVTHSGLVFSKESMGRSRCDSLIAALDKPTDSYPVTVKLDPQTHRISNISVR